MAVQEFSITRRIELDMAHRVPDHGSQCFHLHGHRYRIEATVVGPLFTAGEQNGMVLDFGFLKRIMMEKIHAVHDHGLTLYNKDPILDTLTAPNSLNPEFVGAVGMHPNRKWLKLYLLDGPPTAEVLAAHWFNRIKDDVRLETQGQGQLHCIDVFETPNSIARYPHYTYIPARVSMSADGTRYVTG